jgi:3-hydroxy-9,10-secoandrosta-1,3,5(10)-triene-9,17-dione monooxygenase
MFPPQAQDEIWGKSPDALIASSFVFPAAKARKVKDGYLISGRWPFSSGVDPSEWNMLAGLAWLDENAPPEQRVFLLHRSQYRIIDNWYAGGLRGTAARTSRQASSSCRSTGRSRWPTRRAGRRPAARSTPDRFFRIPVFALFPTCSRAWRSASPKG